MPQLRPAYRAIQAPIALAFKLLPRLRGSVHKNHLVMVRDGAIDHGLVKAPPGNEKCRKLVGYCQHVPQTLFVSCSGNAALSHPIIVQDVFNLAYLFSVKTGLRGKQIVFMVNPFLEPKFTFQQECALVSSQDHAHKGEIAGLQGVIVIITHAGRIGLSLQSVWFLERLLVFKVPPAGKTEHILINQVLRQHLQRIAFQPIVAVEEQDIIATCLAQARISRRRKTSVGLPDDFEPSILCCIRLQYDCRVVSGAVINANGLPIVESLVTDAVETIKKVFLDVVDRYDNREKHTKNNQKSTYQSQRRVSGAVFTNANIEAFNPSLVSGRMMLSENIR